MLGAPSEGSGKTNWPLAIAASVAVHAAIIGPVLFFSRESAPEAATERIEAPGGESAIPGGQGAEVADGATGGAGDPSPADTAGSSPDNRANPADRSHGAGDGARDSGATSRPPRQSGGASGDSGSAPGGASGAAAAPETEIYTVRPGDSLTRIARNHGTTVAELADLNGIPRNKGLDIGEKLKVPRQPARP